MNLEMFEGKDGIRIYKRKVDAQFAAERSASVEGEEASVREVRVSDPERAQEMGLSVHPDLSIAAEKPEEGESGWIVVSGSGDEEKEEFEGVLEFVGD